MSRRLTCSNGDVPSELLPAVDPEALQDPEVRALLAELDAIFEANPLEAYNNPELPKRHEKQMEFHAIKSSPMGVKAAIAGSRAGKTVACVVDDIIQLVDEKFVPNHLKDFKKFEPPVTIWIGAPKMDTHMKNTIPLFRKFLPKEQMIEAKFSKSFKSQPPEIRLTNGSTVAFKSYDMDLDAWAAAEVHRIHWDEEPNTPNSRELRTEARMRLISTGGDEIIGMTPVLGALSWVNDEVWEARNSDPSVAVVPMTIWDNPWNGPEVIAEIEKGLTEDEKRVRLYGEFIHLGGLFFEEFSDRLHVVDPITPDHLRDQEIVVGIDPGRNRTGVVWLAFDSDNSALVFDEFFPKGATVAQVAQEIKQRNAAWGLGASKDGFSPATEPTYVIDPTARNLRSEISQDEVAAAYARSEIYCQPGQNSRAAGILEIKRRLQEKDAEGRPAPAVLYARNCHETIRQTERYARDPKAKDEWQAIPQTDNVRFDLVDAKRYGIMARTWNLPGEVEVLKDPPHYDPILEPPFDPNEFLIDAPPLGDLS